MWASTILAFVAVALLVNPKTRNNETTLPIACVASFVSLWIEKGGVLVLTGYTPSPLETITPYHPTGPEVSISMGVWASGS